LIGVEPFGPAAEAMALQFFDDSDEALDLATGSGEPTMLRRSPPSASGC